MDPIDPKQLVADGYDRLAERYRAWSGSDLDGPRGRFVALLTERLPAGAAILELGCATGVPVARALAEHFAVTGVDLSPRQIEMARVNVPAATFIHGDMTALDFPAASFAAVIACFAITHVPRAEHPALFAAIARWLRPGGLFIASLGTRADPGTVEPDWLGAPMFFSGDDIETGLSYLRAARFAIESADVITEIEDGVPVPFLWVVARAPGTSEGPPRSAS